MGLSKKELRDRWKTEDGRDRLARVVVALRGADQWEHILDGFPGVDEIETGDDLRGAEITHESLEGAELWWASLESAELSCADLEGANFHSANLEGAGLGSANLKNADFSNCSLAGASFFGAEINNKTDFRGSNIDSILCRHETLNHIKYNNRRLNWEDWYKKRPVAQWPVRLFWWLSEYGTSEKNLFISFILGAFTFAMIYGLFPETIIGMSIYEGEAVTVPLWIRAIYFSIVTMTTLGFGDIHASPHSIWGHVFLTAQVLMGYMLLGALVSRLAILFQSGGPTDIIDPDSLDELEKELLEYESAIRDQARLREKPRW